MKIALALLYLCASQALAALLSAHSKAHYQHGLSRGFGPHLTDREYKKVRQGPNKQLLMTNMNAEQVAIEFAHSQLTKSDFVVQSSYRSDLNGVTHVYLRQKVNGLEVFNGDMNINIDRFGQIISFGNSFSKKTKKTNTLLDQWILSLSPVKTIIRPDEAIRALLSFMKRDLGDIELVQIQTLKQQDSMLFDNVPFAESPVEVRQGYLQLENGDLQLVWDIQYELQDNWYNSHIHAHDGSILSLIDWVSTASYNVIPFTFDDPNETPRQLLKDPHDTWSSPYGWQTQGNQKFNVTIGNNVYAHTNPDGGNEWLNNYRPTGTDQDGELVFDFPVDFETQEPSEYEDAAVTNLFYWCNIAHDFFYRYGFDEKAGNFQQLNLGRGGAENDAVIANAQDGSGKNNANFATPPDGRHGKMRMYIWDQSQPMRDGDFESGIIMHEYTHGVSIRLTGGPMNSNCLAWGEAGGMGEGWGDFIATVIQMRKESKRTMDYSMGDYANGGQGIRRYKYSTSTTTNPSTYKVLDKFDYWGVHAKGEVWAEMLYEVYWNLVDRLGFTPDWFPPVPKDTLKPTMDPEDLEKVRNHVTSYGNTLAVQLVIDGLKLQPCNPDFTNARDAILEAEKQLTGGKYYCDIYRAFAKRGLGVGAKLQKVGWLEQRVESFDEPEICK